jgi:hypothetical protein
MMIYYFTLSFFVALLKNDGQDCWLRVYTRVRPSASERRYDYITLNEPPNAKNEKKGSEYFT